MQSKLKTLQPYAILLLILLIAYLPLSTFYFGMKNDAFSDNFPNKFFISEALRSHHLPLWNSYLNYGFPVYADMGFAFYNPITWVFAFVGYNAYTLTLEVLLYIYLGGIFMYRLSRYLGLAVKISITVAAMYMCSGFYTGSLDYINFLTAAAFLPLLIEALLKLFNAPTFKASFVLSLAAYFVFAGGHPAIPIMLVYFGIIVTMLLFIFNKPYRVNAKKIILHLFAATLLFILFYLPAIYSYTTMLPYYERSSPEAQYLYTSAGFTTSSYISFLYPFTTAATKNMFGTDATMRNGFFSVLGIICVFCSIKSKLPLVKVFIISACLMLVFSAGGTIKGFLYSHLPLLNYIRYNGEFRVLAILGFCIAAGFGLQRLFSDENKIGRYLSPSFKIVLAASILIFAATLVLKNSDVSGAVKNVAVQSGFAQKVKEFLNSPLAVFLIISTVITIAVCVASIYAIKKNKLTLLLVITIADLCMNSILYLPVTGVGQKTVSSIQAVYNTSPKGIPIPPLVAVNSIDTLQPVLTGLVGDISFYNKKIGTTRLTDYPSYFITTDSFFQNKKLVAEISAHPYLFLQHADSLSPAVIRVEKFNPQKIEIQVTAAQDDSLIFLQNNYRFWHAIVNNKLVPIQTAYTTFIAIKVNKGVNDVVLYYDDRWLFACLIISLLAFLTCLVIIYRVRAIYK